MTDMRAVPESGCHRPVMSATAFSTGAASIAFIPDGGRRNSQTTRTSTAVTSGKLIKCSKKVACTLHAELANLTDSILLARTRETLPASLKS